MQQHSRQRKHFAPPVTCFWPRNTSNRNKAEAQSLLYPHRRVTLGTQDTSTRTTESGSAILAVPAQKGSQYQENQADPITTRKRRNPGLGPTVDTQEKAAGTEQDPTPTRRPGRTDHPSFPSGGNCLDLCHTRWKAHEGRVYEEEHCRQEGEGDSEVDEVVHDRTHVVADPQLKPKSVPSTVRGLRQPAYRQAVPRNEKNCVRVWSASKRRK